MENQSLISFLKRTVSQEEASLLVARDKKELDIFEKELKKNSFSKVKDAFTLAKKIESEGRFYVRFDSILPKDFYDFLMQYPTRQVELFHGGKMKSLVVTPRYEGVSIIVITTREALANTEKSGLIVRRSIGMVYQT